MKPGVRLNLQARYTVQIVIVIAVIAVSLTLLSAMQFKSRADEISGVTSDSFAVHLHDEVRERGWVLEANLAPSLAIPLLHLDMRAMREQLQATVSQQDVMFAYVYDVDGKIVHDGSDEVSMYGQHIDESLGWPASELTRPHQHMVNNELHVVSPVLLGDKSMGAIAIGISLDSANAKIFELEEDIEDLHAENRRDELRIAGVFTVLSLALGSLFALFSGYRLAKPMRVLARQAQRVGQGVFEDEIVIRRNDEVGDLANSFRTMSYDLQASNREINFLAYHDVLTGLPNRVRFKEKLDELCNGCKEQGSLGAVLFVDLDEFKPINDTLGHYAGDALLCEVADRLQQCLRTPPYQKWCLDGGEAQSVARLGGDEFAIALKGLDDPEDAASVAKTVLAELSTRFRIAGEDVTIGASIGIAICPDDGRDADSLLGYADMAMYSVKRAGKQSYRFYEEFMYESTRDRVHLIRDLRRALDNNELQLRYQPIADSDSGRTVGAEALVRWHHPDRGLMHAGEFIDLAEKSGEVSRLGRWVLDRACQDLVAWRKQGIDEFFVSINLSSQQMLHDDLPEFVTASLEQHGLSTSDLRLEAGEDSFFADDDGVIDLLNVWTEAGYEVWVDQFGSGPASLLNLLRVRPHGVKLSPAFILDITVDPRARQFVEGILAFARMVNLDVCAVGVTSEAAANWLREHGCRYLQGQYLGPELSVSDLADYLEFQPANDRTLSGKFNLKALN